MQLRLQHRQRHVDHRPVDERHRRAEDGHGQSPAVALHGKRHAILKSLRSFAAVLLFSMGGALFAAAPETLPRCTAVAESGLPLPSAYAHNNDPGAYQNLLANFLRADTYE